MDTKINDSKYLLQDEKYMSDLLTSKGEFIKRILELHAKVNKPLKGEEATTDKSSKSVASPMHNCHLSLV